MYKNILLICACLLVQACASAPPIDQFSPEQIASLTKVTNTEFDSHIKVVGVDIGNTVTRGLNLDIEKYFMRSDIGKFDSLIESHQLYFEVKYTANDWRFYDGANLKGGVPINTTQISREVVHCSGNMFGACNYREVVGITFSYSDLMLASKEGVSVRFNTRYTDVFSYAYLPPNYFQGYLNVINKHRG
ncbi:hypothetical protein [Thalassomonas haliotis]|uniref:Lipoprotein n=1 Tax=Thalassomonas haliotis TaxID=485448 RepID=A0ABY7VAJ0_9GAMM|nr:hypothetical protein [Thalassomonas haliotis]WDE10402.1 hypothetical protein H3N35_19295 [Thalassomonas haliotis]